MKVAGTCRGAVPRFTYDFRSILSYFHRLGGRACNSLPAVVHCSFKRVLKTSLFKYLSSSLTYTLSYISLTAYSALQVAPVRLLTTLKFHCSPATTTNTTSTNTTTTTTTTITTTTTTLLVGVSGCGLHNAQTV